MNNSRYLQFLTRLKERLDFLKKNPQAQEIIDVPRSTFELYIKSFRSNLDERIKQGFPPHNLSDPNYIDALVGQIDFFVGEARESGTDKQLLANMPAIKNLVAGYESSQQLKQKIDKDLQTWKKIYESQLATYNKHVVENLQAQFAQEIHSLPKDKRESLAKNIANTIQNQGLGGIQTPEQTKEIIKQITRQALQEEIARAEDYQAAEITARPQAIEEIVNRTAQNLEQETWGIRQEQFHLDEQQLNSSLALQSPQHNLNAYLLSVIALNLPAEAADPEIISSLTGEIIGRIHAPPNITEAQYKDYIEQTVRQVLTYPKAKKILAEKGVTLSPSQQEQIADAVPSSPEVVHNAFVFSQSPEALAIGQMAAGGFGGTPRATQAPMATLPNITLGTNINAPSGSILYVLNSQGEPGHIFTALASPRAGNELFKYFATLGPFRSFGGFILDAIPGAPKLDYLHLSLEYLRDMKIGLEDQRKSLLALLNGTASAKDIPLLEKQLGIRVTEKYQLERKLGETENRLKILDPIWKQVEKHPFLRGAHRLFFGETDPFTGKITRWGLYHILHPINALKNQIIFRNIFLGLGFSSVFDVFSYSVKYGSESGVYVAEEILKQFFMLVVKYALYRSGIYTIVKVPGLPGGRFVFKPWYDIKLKLKEGLYKTILKPGWEATKTAFKTVTTKAAAGLTKAAAGTGIKALGAKILLKIGEFLGKAAAKLLAALAAAATAIGTIISVVLLALQVWDFIRPLIEQIFKAIRDAVALLAASLLSMFSPTAIIGGLATGFSFGTYVGLVTMNPVAGLVVFGASSVASTVFYQLAMNMGASLGKGLMSAVSLGGNLLQGLTGAASSIVSSTFSVLAISGIFTLVGSLIIVFHEVVAFWIPTEATTLQSKYIDVGKKADFGGNIGQPIKYTLTVSANKSKLTNIKISDTTVSTCKGTSPSIPERNFTSQIPAEVLPSNPLVLIFEVATNQQFNDCLINNTAYVTADVPDAKLTGEKSFSMASVTIGNPPISVPSMWPTTNGCITQGPGGSDSHYYSGHTQAIDINHSLMNKPALATFNGGVSLVVRGHPTYGNYVIVSGTSQTGGFTVLYAHLQTIAVTQGQQVKLGNTVGTIGQTGNAVGIHLHYEFQGLKMAPPYIPQAVPACVGRATEGGTCNICW